VHLLDVLQARVGLIMLITAGIRELRHVAIGDHTTLVGGVIVPSLELEVMEHLIDHIGRGGLSYIRR
jgi:hypothetical protein